MWIGNQAIGQQQSGQPAEMSWLQYTVINNPQGVMAVLNRYGYLGYLAPQDIGELLEAAQHFIERYDDVAVEELLRVHPDWDIIRQVPGDSGYMNAIGGGSGLDMSVFTSKNLWLAIGVFVIAYVLID